MKLYLAGPITGLTLEEANAWRTDPLFVGAIEKHGWEPSNPLDFNAESLPSGEALSSWFEGSASACRDAVKHDLKLIVDASAVFACLLHGEGVSVGTMMELGFAYGIGKPIVIVREPAGPYDHPFITELAVAVVDDMISGVYQLVQVARQLNEPAYA